MRFVKALLLSAVIAALTIAAASAQSIVGAWSGGDTTKEGGAVLVFFANNSFYYIENVPRAEAPEGFPGFERGTYTWNATTGALTMHLLQDNNGNTGAGAVDGLAGITATISGNTLSISIPGGGGLVGTRVTGASPIVGGWFVGDAAVADNSAVLVFLPNGVYFMAEDGDSTVATGDPTGHDGIEVGTYSWNASTGALTSSRTPAPFIDTNGQWGLSDTGPDATFKVSADGATLTVTTGGGVTSAARVGAANTAAPNYQGLWWKPDESGWGVNFAHQGDKIFATWYTYDTAGNAYWLTMLAERTTPTGNAYHGDINVTVGPAFSNFTGGFQPTRVGEGTITFTDANTGTFAYNLDAGTGGAATAISQSKPITRYVLDAGSAQPVCTYQSAPDLNAATNYQDLWWLPSESGWGANFAHQGDKIYATWYTFDAKGAGNNAPLWLTALLSRSGTSNVFSGDMHRTAGARFDNFKSSDIVQPAAMVGSATLTFADGNHGTFRYVTNSAGGLPVVDQTKSITRLQFTPPAATVCR